jgi:hypothetical protein
MAAAKLDLKQDYRELCQAGAEVRLVRVLALTYLMVDGAGDPNTSPRYQEAVEALFTVSYTARSMVKKGPQGIDFARLWPHAADGMDHPAQGHQGDPGLCEPET